MDWCIENGDWNGSKESYEALNDPVPGGSPINSLTNGTGPFKLELWEQGIQITLIRNDNYWGTPASFERVSTKIVEEWGTRKLMLELGDADCALVPNEAIQEMKETPGISVYENVLTLLNQALFFQFDIDPYSTMIGSGQLDGNGIPIDFFTDTDVRKGFAYAFDWDTYINDAMVGYGEQISSPIVKGVPYYKPDWPSYELDLIKAEEHLKTAWNGSLWENGFEMTLVYASGDITGKVACEILQYNLFEINPLFKINIQLMAWPTILSEMVLGRLPMYLNGWTADYPDPHNFVFPYMHSKGTFANAQGYSNEVVDDLIEQAISSSSHSERQLLYDQIAGLYYDEAPSIMISQVLGVYFFRDWIQGFVHNPIRPAYEDYAYYLSKGY
jgi:peptide/nickel transport system substrate-binding protein